MKKKPAKRKPTATTLQFREVLRRLDRIESTIDHVHLHVQETHRRQDQLMATVTDLKAKIATLTTKVEHLTDVSQAVVTFVTGLAAIIASLKQQLADALANDADPAAIQEVIDALGGLEATIDADAAKIGAAVVAGTPAE